MKAIPLCFVLAAVVGCGSASAKKLNARSAHQLNSPAALTASQNPQKTVTEIIKTWRHDLTTAARVDPRKRFHNLSRPALLARLRSEAVRHHFDVVTAEILRPRQAAPLVVVKTDDKKSFVAATPTILHSIDPKARTNDDRTGWAYEGFLFEALGSDNAPFLVVFNNWRGPHAGGGQWAANASLYPFAHG
jgi:hypothetical protein